MHDDDFADQCQDPTEELTLRIPCTLAERVAAFASENDSTLSSVVIEALDFFLRHRLRV